MKLFLTAYIQVAFITIQTWLIAKELLLPVFLVGFTISFVWAYNVKKVSIGGMRDRLIYSFGASIGALSMMILVKMI